MKNILKIISSDIKRLRTNVVAIVVLIGLTVIPSLYAWFNILSNWDPYEADATSRIKVAVATEDLGVVMEGVEVNIGDSIVEALHENNTIGWVFTETSSEAMEGVESGEYYAALVIPESFSSDMVSFMTGDLNHPKLEYYCNQKKNAIAPKITDKAKTAVREQVNATFISTIAGTLIDTGSDIANSGKWSELTDKENASMLDVITARLSDTYNELLSYNTMLESLIAILDLSESVMGTAGEITPDLTNELMLQQAQLYSLQKLIDENNIESLSGLSEIMSDNITNLSGILDTVMNVYGSMSGDADSFKQTIAEGKQSVTDTKLILDELTEKLSGIISMIDKIQNGDSYGMLSQLLNSDAETLGSFVSSPVEITTEKLYPIDHYGSAASPFYVVLSIWVGGLILVAIMHTPVHKAEDIPENAKPYQKFFGRYFTFFAIGQLQTLLMVSGNMFFINIQCLSPLKYWFACAVTSMVFTLFMYSLTVAFGNIGEALAIIFMVVQVAGSGGTFPIEVLPEAYKMIYNYMPFPYAMDALRECIGGAYGNYYWECIGKLLIFAAIALFIGLILRIPFVKINKAIEKSKESTGVML